MESLIEFYGKVLKSTGFVVTEDGYIKMPMSGRSKVNDNVKVGSKVLVLPLKEHFNTMWDTIDGKKVLAKTIFNPLKEDVVKGDSESLVKLKSIIEIRLGYSIINIFTSVLELALNKEKQKNMSLELSTLLGSMKEAKNQNITNVIDTNTLDKFNKISATMITPSANKGMIHIYLKKGGVVNSVKYNRLALASFPFYNELCKYEKDGSIAGVKLRPKDVKVFKIIYEYIFNNINVENYYTLGSTDKTSPGFISLFRLYLTIVTRTNELLNLLGFVNEVCDLAKIDIVLEDRDLDNLARFDRELAVIPNDNESNRSLERLVGNTVTEPAKSVDGKIDAKSLLYGNAATQNIYPTYANPVQQRVIEEPVYQDNRTQMDTSMLSPAQKILYGNDFNKVEQAAPITYNPSGYVSPYVQQQQQYFGAPVFGAPVYQQPVYGQGNQYFGGFSGFPVNR